MKNLYYLIETDYLLECAEVLQVFTNKKKAISECRKARRLRKINNNLRRIEGRKERNTNRYILTNTTDFIESTGYKGGFQKVPQDAIIKF